LQAYFEGRKALIEGLAMEQLEKEWPQHPCCVSISVG
jgi:hypothetical protein